MKQQQQRQTRGWLVDVHPAVEAALGPDMEMELPSITYDEVVDRLVAAELGGLAATVWAGIEQSRGDSSRGGPVLVPASRPTDSLMATERAVANQTAARSARATTLRRAGGYNPRGERGDEPWAFHEGEGKYDGCFKAIGLILYNFLALLGGICGVYKLQNKA